MSSAEAKQGDERQAREEHGEVDERLTEQGGWCCGCQPGTARREAGLELLHHDFEGGLLRLRLPGAGRGRRPLVRRFTSSWELAWAVPSRHTHVARMDGLWRRTLSSGCVPYPMSGSARQCRESRLTTARGGGAGQDLVEFERSCGGTERGRGS
jgi:hypothetical protein